MKPIVKNILRGIGMFAAVLAVLLSATFVSELVQPRTASGWEPADAEAELIGCGELQLTVTNREAGFPGSPGTPKINSIVPSSVVVTSPLTPAVLENTGSAKAVALLSAPLDLEATVRIEGEINYSGTDGSDTKHWSAEVDVVPCEIEAKALCDHQIDDTEWHFVITQLTSNAQAPATIHVVWENGDEADVPLDKITGSTAHYATTENLDFDVTAATALLLGSWDGQFNLSHGPACGPPVTTTTSTTSTSTTSTSTTSTTMPPTTTTSTTMPPTTTTTICCPVTTTTSTTQPSTTTTSSTVPETTTTTSSTVPETTTTTRPDDTTTTTVYECVPPATSDPDSPTVCLIPPVTIEAPPAVAVPTSPRFTG